MANTIESKPTQQEQESRMMKHDFYRAVIINSLFVVAIVALYFINRQTGILDKLASKF